MSEQTEEVSVRVVPLFGGAISIAMPSSFEDISLIREVPDHQEVYVDKYSDLSLIVELLSFEESVADDKAASHFYTDLASFNEASSSIVCHNELVRDVNFISAIPSKFAKSVLIGYQSVKKFEKTSIVTRDSDTRGNSSIKEPSDAVTVNSGTSKSMGSGSGGIRDTVQIVMILIRLPQVGTDVLITLNNPTKTKQLEYPSKCLCVNQAATADFTTSAAAAAVVKKTSVEIMKCVAKSFQIHDWSLFV